MSFYDKQTVSTCMEVLHISFNKESMIGILEREKFSLDQVESEKSSLLYADPFVTQKSLCPPTSVDIHYEFDKTAHFLKIERSFIDINKVSCFFP